MSCGHPEAFQVIPSAAAKWYCRRCDDRPPAPQFDDEWRYRLPKVGEAYAMTWDGAPVTQVVSVISREEASPSSTTIVYTMTTGGNVYHQYCTGAEWLLFVGQRDLRRIR